MIDGGERNLSVSQAMALLGTILLVDDDPAIREGLGQELRDAGYEVTSFAGGRPALEYLRAGARPDVIVLDLLMPEFDGWDFRAEQKNDARLASIPVLSFSAVGRLIDTPVALRKPAEVEQIVRAIEGLRQAV